MSSLTLALFKRRHVRLPLRKQYNSPRVSALGHHEVHEEPPYAAVAVHVRMNVDEYEMPEHHAHRRMLFVDEQLEQRSIASLTA
jgi:hypothetical protein